MVKHIMVRIDYEPPGFPIQPGEPVELTFLHTKLAKSWKRKAGPIATAIIHGGSTRVRLDDRHVVVKISEEEREW
jgi:hypothetical protein